MTVNASSNEAPKCYLVLDDGTVFPGRSFGAYGEIDGEIGECEGPSPSSSSPIAKIVGSVYPGEYPRSPLHPPHLTVDPSIFADLVVAGGCRWLPVVAGGCR
jgi:hypothetical protein